MWLKSVDTPALRAYPPSQKTPVIVIMMTMTMMVTVMMMMMMTVNINLLSEVPPCQQHHEVRPRNLTETLRIILVEESAPPFSDLINSRRTF